METQEGTKDANAEAKKEGFAARLSPSSISKGTAASGDSAQAKRESFAARFSPSNYSKGGGTFTEAVSNAMSTPVQVKSKLSLSRPQTHRLPRFVIWFITLVVPVVVALVNFAIVILEHLLKDNKFLWMQNVMTANGVVAGAWILAGVSAIYAGIATCLVSYISPLCAGSGLPEAKGYLNGNEIPRLFSFRDLCVRVIGITLSCASGFPVGREGPMVCIGGAIGYEIVQLLALPFVQRWVDVHVKGDDSEITPALIVDQERYAHAKRIGCALGGAAGIASAFAAPIGGILYMFEEVTVTSWPPELTFRAFVTTVLAALCAQGLLNVTGQDVHHLVIYDDAKSATDNEWSWKDVPFFLLLAIVAGLFSAYFSRCLLWVWSERNRFKLSSTCKRFKREIRAFEVVVFVVICALAFAFAPLLIDCVDEPTEQVTDDAGSRLTFVRHDCPEGQHREMATVLLTGAEAAVKHLFSRHVSSSMRIAPLLGSICVYSVLVIGMPGLPVPMGLFIPCLLIGALMGRSVGEIARKTSLSLAHPGVYALVGSACMLSGFTHMTIAIVVLLVEAAADLTLVSPIMLGIFVASITSKLVNHHAYDEVLIFKKGVPFLDAEVPHEMDNDGSTAADLCEVYPEEALVPPMASASSILRALDCNERRCIDFPVVERGRCIGLTSRTRLEATVQAYRHAATIHSEGSGGSARDVIGQLSMRHLHEEDQTLGIVRFLSNLAKADGTSSSSETNVIPVHRIMDPAPYTILEDMPAPRLYPLFVKAGVTAACVVTNSGLLVGVLTRNSLISKFGDAHFPPAENKASRDKCRQVSGSSLGTNRSRSDSNESDPRDSLIQSLQEQIKELKAAAGERSEGGLEGVDSKSWIAGDQSRSWKATADPSVEQPERTTETSI